MSDARERPGAVRWGDIYPASIAYRWVDVIGLPDGNYKLKVFADPASEELPDGNFVESDETTSMAGRRSGSRADK